VIARHQTAGRGRQGRSWLSTEGAFLATYIIRIDEASPDLSGFSLMVGLMLHRFLRSIGVTTAVKWPNDILSTDGKKLAGILIEVIPASGGQAILCGIGCNLVMTQEALPSSASVRDCGGVITRGEVIGGLTPILVEGTARFISDGFDHFKDEWMDNAFRFNGPVVIRSGQSTYAGLWRGLTSRGELILAGGEDGERIVTTGEVEG
jgi:BirA family biotin operon repressor/biotin-[acetyl-CoA-carboxylase] ligase